VKAPVEAVPEPIGPGAAKVAAPNVVALIVPVPLIVNDAPEPTTIAAVVFVALVIALKAVPEPVDCQVAVVALVAVGT
jgi:hypothetical protein